MRILRGFDGAEPDARQSLRLGQGQAPLQVVVGGKRDVYTRLVVERALELAFHEEREKPGPRLPDGAHTSPPSPAAASTRAMTVARRSHSVRSALS